MEGGRERGEGGEAHYGRYMNMDKKGKPIYNFELVVCLVIINGCSSLKEKKKKKRRKGEKEKKKKKIKIKNKIK